MNKFIICVEGNHSKCLHTNGKNICQCECHKKITGNYVCTYCGNAEDREREIICWKCSKGEMVYTVISELKQQLDKIKEKYA